MREPTLPATPTLRLSGCCVRLSRYVCSPSQMGTSRCDGQHRDRHDGVDRDTGERDRTRRARNKTRIREHAAARSSNPVGNQPTAHRSERLGTQCYGRGRKARCAGCGNCRPGGGGTYQSSPVRGASTRGQTDCQPRTLRFACTMTPYDSISPGCRTSFEAPWPSALSCGGGRHRRALGEAGKMRRSWPEAR